MTTCGTIRQVGADRTFFGISNLRPAVKEAIERRAAKEARSASAQVKITLEAEYGKEADAIEREKKGTAK